MLIDTHCHLNFPDYDQDLDQVLSGALKNGVTKIICVSSNLADSKKAVDIASKYPRFVYAAVGIHPHQTDPENEETEEKQIQELEKLALEKEVVAIGECGLDYSEAPPREKNRSQEKQLFLFQEQIKLAKKLKLPLLVHSRKAFADIIEILEKDHDLCGVFHCYSAGKSGIEKVRELDFYFGLDGNLTYDPGLQKVISLIPLEKILLETDAPFLSPVPYRGQRNEPKNVKIISEYLAKIKNTSQEEVEKITSHNSKLLFNI